MSEVLRALEGPIAPMSCASDEPDHLICDRSVPLHRQRAVGPGPRRDHRHARRHDPRRPRPRPPHRPRTEPHAHRSPFVTDANDRELVITDLHVAPVANPEHEILQGIDLTIRKGETHAIMGPNGSGKTTLGYALMGHPAYIVKSGAVELEGLRPAEAVARQALPARAVPRLPVPHRDPGPVRRVASSAARSTRSSRASTRTPTSTRRTRPAAASRCSTSGAGCARRWPSSRWRTASRPAT